MYFNTYTNSLDVLSIEVFEEAVQVYIQNKEALLWTFPSELRVMNSCWHV